ncbi:MAG: hypothetical protein CFE45_00290 [Burkholderiales bacterium PBB5]|nr:MAG: hypothetical protein CFE45_00290 [Burkholderiales bacterium PBB5]
MVLMFGSIELRKGVGSLLEMASGPAFPADGQVLVVGRQSAEVRALIAALGTGLPAGRLICVDRYVDRQDEWLAFAAADYGWVAYEGFYGPSGVVAQCRQANLPMIHRGKGLIGYQLRPASHADAPWASAHGLQVSFLASSEPRDRGIGEVIG